MKQKSAIISFITALLLVGYFFSDDEVQMLDQTKRWREAGFTWFNSYAPCCKDNPNYDEMAEESECLDYNACQYSGDFAYIGKQSYAYVQQNNLVSFYDESDPNGANTGNIYGGKTIYLKYKGKEFTAVIADTCGNSDCNDCCHKNQRGGYLVDMEYFTVLRNIGSTKQVKGTIQWHI